MDTNGKPTVISIFAGTGGSSLGYKWAGFKELLAIDFDEHAVECFKLNFPEVPIWHRSVTEVTSQEIIEFCKIKPGQLDVFDGSPPCQGFSTAGKREVRDPRNDLFKHYWRLVTELQPKVFLMENVPGMAKGKMKGRFIEIMQILKSDNYNVKCKQMNSKYYGVPQSRERLIFIGIRKDLGKEPIFPKPSKCMLRAKDFFQSGEGIDISRFAIYNELIDLKPGQKSNKYLNLIKCHPSKPIPCITKTAGCLSAASICSWENNKFSLGNILDFCSFPRDWKFKGSYTQCVERLGNAVMPKFMQAIAETIKKEILNG